MDIAISILQIITMLLIVYAVINALCIQKDIAEINKRVYKNKAQINMLMAQVKNIKDIIKYLRRDYEL